MSGGNGPATITKPKLLLGEGDDEVVFFTAVLASLGRTDVHVHNYHGKRKLKDALTALEKAGDLGRVKSIAITRDGDDKSPTSLFSGLRGMLRGDFQLSVPKRLGEFSDGAPRVGIFLLPDNKNMGNLENLCLKSVIDDKALECVNAFFECVKDKADREPTDAEASKAQCQVWLATHSPPLTRVGHAAERKLWNFDHPAFAPLVAFLKQL